MALEREPNWPSEIKNPEGKNTSGSEERVRFSERLRTLSEKDWEDALEEAKQVTEERMEEFKYLSGEKLAQKHDEIFNFLIEHFSYDKLADLKYKNRKYH